MSLSPQDRAVLLQLAYDSIAHAVRTGAAPKVALHEFAIHLQAPAATFVTLKRTGKLRGCIGTLHAIQPMVLDVANNAYSAAFKDPRFSALAAQEMDDLALSISVLSKPAAMTFESESELLQQLVPSVDGLIISDGERRATFLPSVWDQLPQPKDFLAQLKVKMGLARDSWPTSMTAQRYGVESFGVSAPTFPSQ